MASGYGKFTVFINPSCSCGPVLNPNATAKLQSSFQGSIPIVTKTVIEEIIKCSYNIKDAFKCVPTGGGTVTITANHKGKKLLCTLATVDRKKHFWKIIDEFLTELGCCENLVTLENGNCKQCRGGGSAVKPKARSRTGRKSDLEPPVKRQSIITSHLQSYQDQIQPLCVSIKALPTSTLQPYLKALELRTKNNTSQSLLQQTSTSNQSTRSSGLKLTLPNENPTEIAQPNYLRSPYKTLFPGTLSGNLSPPSSPEAGIIRELFPALDVDLGDDDASPSSSSGSPSKGTSQSDASGSDAGKSPVSDILPPPRTPRVRRRIPSDSEEVSGPSKTPLTDLYAQLVLAHGGTPHSSNDLDSGLSASADGEIKAAYEALDGEDTRGGESVTSLDAATTEGAATSTKTNQADSPTGGKSAMVGKITELEQKNEQLEKQTRKLKGYVKHLAKKQGISALSQLGDLPMVGTPLNIPLEDDDEEYGQGHDIPDTIMEEIAEASLQEEKAEEEASNSPAAAAPPPVCSLTSQEAGRTERNAETSFGGKEGAAVAEEREKEITKDNLNQAVSTSTPDAEQTENHEVVPVTENEQQDLSAQAQNSSIKSETTKVPCILIEDSPPPFPPISPTMPSAHTTGFDPSPLNDLGPISTVTNIRPMENPPAPVIIAQHSSVISNINPQTGPPVPFQGVAQGAGVWGVTNVERYTGIYQPLPSQGNMLPQSQGQNVQRIAQGQPGKSTPQQAQGSWVPSSNMQGQSSLRNTSGQNVNLYGTSRQTALLAQLMTHQAHERMRETQRMMSAGPWPSPGLTQTTTSGDERFHQMAGDMTGRNNMLQYPQHRFPSIVQSLGFSNTGSAQNSGNRTNNSNMNLAVMRAQTQHVNRSQSSSWIGNVLPGTNGSALTSSSTAGRTGQNQAVTSGNQLGPRQNIGSMRNAALVGHQRPPNVSLLASSYGNRTLSSDSPAGTLQVASGQTRSWDFRQFTQTTPQVISQNIQNAITNISSAGRSANNGLSGVQLNVASTAHTTHSHPLTSQIVSQSLPSATNVNFGNSSNNSVSVAARVANTTYSQLATQSLSQNIPCVTNVNSVNPGSSSTGSVHIQGQLTTSNAVTATVTCRPASANATQQVPLIQARPTSVSTLSQLQVPSAPTPPVQPPSATSTVAQPQPRSSTTPSAGQEANHYRPLGPVASTLELKSHALGTPGNTIPRPTAVLNTFNNVLTMIWNMRNDDCTPKVCLYELYGLQVNEEEEITADTKWKLVGVMKALPLPMACTLTHVTPGKTSLFVVRAVAEGGVTGPFSGICRIRG